MLVKETTYSIPAKSCILTGGGTPLTIQEQSFALKECFMSGLGIQDYPAAPSPKKKKNWVKISITALMALIVVGLAGAVASNTLNWLFVHPGH